MRDHIHQLLASPDPARQGHVDEGEEFEDEEPDY
jgi:hypothetical protein